VYFSNVSESQPGLLNVTSDQAISFITHIARPNAFDSIRGLVEIKEGQDGIKDFFTNVFAATQEGGFVDI